MSEQVNFDSNAAAPQFVMHGAVDLVERGKLQHEVVGKACRTSIEVRLLILIRRDACDGSDDLS